MSDFRQIGDVAIEALARAWLKAAAETDDRERARQLRAIVAELGALREAAA